MNKDLYFNAPSLFNDSVLISVNLVKNDRNLLTGSMYFSLISILALFCKLYKINLFIPVVMDFNLDLE